MKLSELLQGVSVVQATVDPNLEITGISYDSRTTKPGDLFVAISGFAADGHRFIPAARKAGAVAVLCEKAPKEAGPYLVTASSRTALAPDFSQLVWASGRRNDDDRRNRHQW